MPGTAENGPHLFHKPNKDTGNSVDVCMEKVLDDRTRKALLKVARFYDRRKVGDVGALGFRRSTDLQRLLP
jgi:hypothetical protein